MFDNDDSLQLIITQGNLNQVKKSFKILKKIKILQIIWIDLQRRISNI